MELGAARTVSEAENAGKRSRQLANVTSVTGGSGTGGGEGPWGGDLPEPPIRDQVEPDAVDKSKYIVWFLLMAVGMTFAGLLGAYLILATNRAAEWRPFDLPVQVWVSTAIILASSVSYSLAKRSVDAASFLKARKWLIVTTALGGTFVSSQLILWIELVKRGFYMSGNSYAGFFYILTAAHLIHVAGGIVALASILLGSWYPPRSEAEIVRRRALARSVGWYWHFMGALWVVLFLMLGFWK